MFKFSLPEEAMLAVPANVVDGDVKYRKVTARVLMMHESDFQPAEGPNLEKSTDFLLTSPLPPVCGTRIRLHNREFQIGSFQVCRDMAGNVICYRCKAVK